MNDNAKIKEQRAIEQDFPVLLSKPEILRRIPVSMATFDRMVAQGLFPPPVRVSRSRVVWPESEVAAWVRAKIAGRGL